MAGGKPKTRHHKVEDVEDLLAYGTPPDQIVGAFGIRPGSLARALHREGRPDLARPFDRLAWHERQPPNRSRSAAPIRGSQSKDCSRSDAVRPRGHAQRPSPGVVAAAGNDFKEAA